ncbi:MAG: hypothetical protein ABW166_18525 [Sedimenticola sp.]
MDEDTVSADGGKEEGTKVTEGGVYLQALTFGVYGGYNVEKNGIALGVFDQVSSGVSVIGSLGVVISLDGIDFVPNAGTGVAVPTGVPSPVTGGVFYWNTGTPTT